MAPPLFARGAGTGERRGRGAGAGLEFAEHRAYQEGDDLRHLDLHAYLRLQQPLVRTFHADRDQTLLLIVDLSGSMDLGRPRKADRAAEMALGLVAAAVQGRDSVELRIASPTAPHPVCGRDRSILGPARAALVESAVGGDLALADILRHVHRRADRAVLITDALVPDTALVDTLRGLRALSDRSTLLQVLAPEDLDPGAEGLLPDGVHELLDVESGERLRAHAGAALRSAWAQEARAWLDRVDRACRALGVQRVPVGTRTALAPVFWGALRRAGVLL